MGKHIIISGAGGFLGRNAALQFSRGGWVVSGIGHASPEFFPQEWGISNWIEADISIESISMMINIHGRPDVVFHSAGSGSVGKSWESPFEDFQRTTLSTAAVIESVRRLAPRSLLIYPSSAAVYGEAAANTLAESSALHPMSPYGLHKLASEDLCLGAHRIFGVRVAIVRFFSIYGPDLRKQLLWEIARKLSAGGETLLLDGTGNELRDFIHVNDATNLLIHLAEHHLAEEPVIINGATGIATSVHAIARHLMESMNSQVKLEFSGRCRPGDPSHLVGDTSRLQQFGFAAEMQIEAGIRHFVESLPDYVAPTPVQLLS